MAIIRYTFADGHTEAVEVTEEFKREYERIERQSHSNDENFRWRARKRETSLEKLREEVDLDIPDDAPAIDEQAIDADFIERFTSVLTKPQKEVFKKAYIPVFRHIHAEVITGVEIVKIQAVGTHNRELKKCRCLYARLSERV